MSFTIMNFLAHFDNLYLLLFLYVLTFISPTEAQISAIFVFGDSTSDPGNNNFIMTPFKSNFLPYGRDFINHIPTGRFTNGRLANDYIAKYLGIKDYVPPYLDPRLNMMELLTGVSFASAGSGFDPLTPKISNVISLPKQLEYFKEYQSRLATVIGKEKTQQMIKNSLFLVSAGTNDFVVNYFTIPVRRKNYTIPAYIDFCLENVQQFMQGLVDLGARRIAVAGLAPMGCLPIVITLYSENAITDRGCITRFNGIAQTYNQKLQTQLNSIQSNRADLYPRIAYVDIYGPLTDMIAQAHKYNFDDVNSGCCGTGFLEASFLCNTKSYVCPDASKYVFWDSIHPTEKSYDIVSQAIQPAIDSIIRD